MRGFFIFCLLAIFQSNAQTAIIAHKSHSGTASSYFIDPNTNFGIPSSIVLKRDTINDSTVVILEQDWSNREIFTRDTIVYQIKDSVLMSYTVKSSKRMYVSPEKDTIDITNDNLKEIYKRIEKDREKLQKQNSNKQPKRSSIPWIVTLTIIAFFFTSNTLKR
jgi:hypothetical protein